MEGITASLERSLQNCSLNNDNSNNNHHSRRRGEGSATDAGSGISSSSDDVQDPNNNHISNFDTTLELNSHISLPYNWEQCLDLKSGEIYYINWRNGVKAKEDPRKARQYSVSRDCESEEDSWYDSEESSSESSCPPSSKERYQGQVEKHNVLVVAGCKGCLMYFMVPKQVEDCPKCSCQLLHFDRSQNVST